MLYYVTSSGWYYCYGAYSMRDITNRQLVTIRTSNSYTLQ